VHLGTHWCLAAINITEKQISYYDSLHGENLDCLEPLRKYVIKDLIVQVLLTQSGIALHAKVFHDRLTTQTVVFLYAKWLDVWQVKLHLISSNVIYLA